ncbi:MAG: S8 family serine peptidase [Pseudomonadota bacterium]
MTHIPSACSHPAPHSAAVEGMLANRRPPLKLLTIMLFAALSLGACGGGGGGSSRPAAAITPPPVNLAPQAVFTLSANSGPAPLIITTDASGSQDNDGSIVSYRWNFAGTQQVGLQASHTFAQAGSFVVSLTVEDELGAQGTSQQIVTVDEPRARVRGRIDILTSTAIDADVNDRLSLLGDNNSFDRAQPIPAPGVIGGFSNIAGSGEPSGALFSRGDPGDFYRVSLNGGEIILLSIAEADADLDLRLWNEQRQIVDASSGLSDIETIQVASGGSYYIEVLAVTGASNYILSLGQNTLANGRNRTATRLSDPLRPGMLIGRRQPGDTHGQSHRELTNRHFEQPFEPLGLYRWAIDKAWEQELRLPAGGVVSANARAKLATLQAAKAYSLDPRMAYAEVDVLVRPHAFEPDDTFYPSQWHYQNIELPAAWAITTGSEDVIVAVVDSGILPDHPDLMENLVPGFDFIRDPDSAADGDGIDSNPTDTGDRGFAGTSTFHGTHVAGTIGARGNNGLGVTGVGFTTRIMPLRTLGRDGGSVFDVLQAVRFAAGLDNTSGTVPPIPADIINLSLGSSFFSQAEQDTYTEVIQTGIIVVASAGNDSSSLPQYPAAYEGVISVSATTISEELAAYSNTGSSIDVAAPGGSAVTDLNGDGLADGVISTSGDDSGTTVEFAYAALSGTSMAAPHVAGVAALMKAVHPGLNTAQFQAALMAGEISDDLGEPGRDDRFGYGQINARKAVRVAQSLAGGATVDPGPLLSASASTLNLGSFFTRREVALDNIGSGSLQIDTVESSEPWLVVTTPGSTDGLGNYLIHVDRTGLSDGAYRGTVTWRSTANDVHADVIMQVSSMALDPDAGLHFVILVDDQGATVSTPVAVSASNGGYVYEIADAPFGRYRLFAGTDADDDSRICDAGEACGAYPTLDSPSLVDVEGDVDNIDFTSGFRLNLRTSTNALPTQPAAATTLETFKVNKTAPDGN